MLGYILLLSIVIAGTGIIVFYGTTALTDSQHQANVERAQEQLSLFDSRTAMVALGDSESQTIQLSGNDGSYAVKNDTGKLTVLVRNMTSGDRETVFQEKLGALVYRNGDTEIAYQGGGVWRQGATGDAIMISPPEFHYRRATLTLPIIQIQNNDGGGGPVSAQVKQRSITHRVFPNESDTFTNLSTSQTVDYTNPIRRSNWTVAVKIKSDYATGWYKYFKERTAGQATYWESNNTARVVLKTIQGSPGTFPIPQEGNSQPVQGIAQEGHAVDEFSLNLAESKHFNNMHWSFYVDRGNVEFELHFYSDGKCTSGSFTGDLGVSVFYRNETASPTIQEEWRNTTIDPNDYSVDCSKDPSVLHIDLVPSSSTSTSTLTYQEIESQVPSPPGTSGNKWMFSADINDPMSDPSGTFDVHDVDTGQYNDGDKEDMSFVVSHYLGLLGPTYDMTVTDGPGIGGGGRVDEGASTGRLVFEEATGAQYLTYLHITDNEITVDIN